MTESYNKLDTIRKAISRGMNILVIGPQGIGKTSAVENLVRKEFPQYKFVYTSVSQMHKGDLLVPMPVEKHGRRYVQYVPHEMFSPYDDDGNERRIVLCLDEFNRNLENPDIYNALLEIMWSRSLNGTPLNLQSVVALANPNKDGRYFNTTQLELTVLERFHIKLPVDMYDLGADQYLLEKYPDHAPAVIEWVLSLPEDKRWIVSPRAQESIIQVYQLGEPIRYVFTDDVTLPFEQLEEALRSNRIWTYKRMLQYPDEAAEAISKNRTLIPLFVALLRLVKTEKDARLTIPILRVLPNAVCLGLWSHNPKAWTEVITSLNVATAEESDHVQRRTN